MSNIEVRTIHEKIEVRAAANGAGPGAIGGYAAPFWKLSEDLGGFREKIAKGAFKSSVAGGDIRALWSHNTDIVLGRTASNTLKLAEDDYGLRFDLDLPDTNAGRDAFTTINRGDVDGVSFGFTVNKESWDFGQNPGDPVTRTLVDVDLIEISPTAFPAYPQTKVSARALDALKEKQEEWAWELHKRSGRSVAERRAAFEAKLRRQRLLSL